MITRPAAFRVYGEPAPKGSMIPRKMRDGRVVVVEDNKRSKPWRRAVAKAAGVRLPERADKYQPLRVTCVFAVRRLPAHASLPYPVMRATGGVGGDLDKLVRCVLDALEDAGVLADDAQVVELADPRKVFADSGQWAAAEDRWYGRPGLYCRVEPVGWVPDPLPYETVLDQHDMT